MSPMLDVNAHEQHQKINHAIHNHVQDPEQLNNDQEELVTKHRATWWFKNVVGLGKSLLEINTVSGEVRRTRMRSCIKCRHLAGNPLRQPEQVTCSIGGEIVWNKAHAQIETCPEGKW